LTLNNLRIPFPVSLGFCLIFFAYTLYQSVHFPPHDFSNSYFGSYFFLRGEFSSDIFDPYTFNKKIYDEGFRDIFISYNPNPPFTALFFIPFAVLPLPVAKFIFNLISCILFLYSVHRLAKKTTVSETLVFILIPVLFFIPIRNQILFGQTYFLLFFLLSEGYLAYESKRYRMAAIVWGIAIFLKIFPAIIVLFLILRKEWKMLLYLASVGGVLLIICLLFQGPDIWEEYIRYILPRSNKGEISSSFTINYQSAHMFFKYLFVQSDAANPTPLLDSTTWFTVSLGFFKSVALAGCCAAILHRKDVLAFALLLFGGMLISPYTSTYSNILLLLLFIPLFGEIKDQRRVFVCCLIFLICNLPLGLFSKLPVFLQFPRLGSLLLFFSLVFYWVSASFKWQYLIAFLFLFLLPEWLIPKPSPDPSRSFLNKETHNLIYDFDVNNGSIVYKYWDNNGENIFNTAKPANTVDYENVFIKNNQIWYKGKQLTYSTDNKSKAGLIDNRYILYLSDKDKGIGFYTLREISPDQNQ
jgi:hypothetical protein